MSSFYQNVCVAAESLKSQLNWDSLTKKPVVGVVLGSGLGDFVNTLKNTQSVPYSKVENMPVSSVAGHSGNWVVGELETGQTILVQQGRVHYYEGYTFDEVTTPIRMMKELGLERVVLTNASGCVNPNYRPGDFMLIADQINMLGTSPLIGVSEEDFGTRFVDMSEPYNLEINARTEAIIKKDYADIRVHQGTYCGVTGPQYETPSEIRLLHQLGGDAVGMSTVAECIAAKHAGLTVNGIASITNMGAGLIKQKIEHGHVKEMGQKIAPNFTKVLNVMLSEIFAS